MFALLVAATAFAPSQPPTDPHNAINPLYKSQLDTGLPVGKDVATKLPAPTMPDGLDAAKQKAIITKLIGDDSYEDFTGNSQVAPQRLILREAVSSDPKVPIDPKNPARGVDIWFVVYGELKWLDDEKFLDRISNSGRGEGKGTSLTVADLAKRKIVVADPKQERFGHIEFDFLDRVRIRATGRAATSKTADSVLVASEIDPRFRGDADFPNQWQSLTKDDGAVKVGAVNQWGGAGFYLKITKLAEPAGALFVEQHIVFTEPVGWFDGANLLRSKLPPVVQSNVRSMRKEWAKMAK